MNIKERAESRLETIKENYLVSQETQAMLLPALENLINLDELFYKAKANGSVDESLIEERNQALDAVSKILLLCSPVLKVDADSISA